MAKDHRVGIGERTSQALKAGDPPASVVDHPDAPPCEVEFELRWQNHAQRVLIHIPVHGRDLPVPPELREHGHGRHVACVNDHVRRSEAFHARRRDFSGSAREVSVRENRYQQLASKLPRPKRPTHGGGGRAPDTLGL